jgi:hypothetical protein
MYFEESPGGDERDNSIEDKSGGGSDPFLKIFWNAIPKLQIHNRRIKTYAC